jgi:protein TonB
MLYLSFRLPQQESDKNAPIEVTLVQPQENTPKQNRDEDRIKKQIVQQDEKANTEDSPKDAKYLSAANRKVEKETVAARLGQFHNSKSLAIGEDKTPRPANQALHKPKAASANSATQSAKSAKDLDLRDIYKTYDSGLFAKNKNLQKNLDESGPQNTGEPPVGSMNPSQTDDYIKDAEKGVETLVNAREFKYFSYYSRIRRQLSQYWEPLVREKFKKIYRMGRAPAAESRDRTTKLMIVLNSTGNLVKIQVLADSGILDLDDAAIEAFQKAAPFPNPPNGIVEGDGMVRIRWDFILET